VLAGGAIKLYMKQELSDCATHWFSYLLYKSSLHIIFYISMTGGVLCIRDNPFR
jgi:hypothetical protein